MRVTVVPGGLPFALAALLLGTSLAHAQAPDPPPSSSPSPVAKIGGSVKSPMILSAEPPQSSEEARHMGIHGNVLVYLLLGVDGKPTNIKVLRGLGYGLDERAVAAVKNYRFKPAMRDGQPVAVEMNVEVNF